LLAETKRAANKKKKVSLGVLLASFGISGAGKGTGGELSAHFGTIDKLLDASHADLLAIPNVGPTTAQSVYDYITTNRRAIEDLLNFVEPEKPKTGIMSGKTFVFTGSPPQGKDYWIDKVQNEGGKVSGSVSKKTDYVVYGAEAGQKLDKAKDLKATGSPIQIIDAHELKALLGLDKNDDRAF
jgi:DNA ligase (NAD+)